MKAVFAAIVLEKFVFWGVGGAGGLTNQVIAEVNGERITDTAFQRVMRNMLAAKVRLRAMKSSCAWPRCRG